MRVGYEIVDYSRVGYNHLISNQREWNNCFIKKAHKISLDLPDLILWENTPEKTRDFRSSHVYQTVNAQTGWIENQNIVATNTFIGILGF